jgi:hypothetical protein
MHCTSCTGNEATGIVLPLSYLLPRTPEWELQLSFSLSTPPPILKAHRERSMKRVAHATTNITTRLLRLSHNIMSFGFLFYINFDVVIHVCL